LRGGLVEQRVLQGVEGVGVHLPAAQPAVELGVVIGETGAGEGVDAFHVAQGALRVGQVLDREGVVGPVRAPRRHGGDVAGGGCRLPLCQHGGGGADQEVPVLQPVAGDDVVLHGHGQARACLDADDPVVEEGGVGGQL